MSRSRWYRDPKELAELAAERSKRFKEAWASRKQRAENAEPQEGGPPVEIVPPPVVTSKTANDLDTTILQEHPNSDLLSYVELFDSVSASSSRLSIALLWPHVPPRPILPWMIREVCRGICCKPLRTLLINVGRPSLQSLSGIEVLTARLRARGVYRSGLKEASSKTQEISPDAHFYMFLGDSRIDHVPLVSIMPHTIALNDGTYWRDFDEKTLKGFKRHFSLERLRSIKTHLATLTSAQRSPAFAFLLPPHFDTASRTDALSKIPANLDLAVIDLSTQVIGAREASELLCAIIAELEALSHAMPKQVLVLADCPLRYAFLRAALGNRRSAGSFGTRIESHKLRWTTRGRGFDPPSPHVDAPPPIVETTASQECVVATRLWQHAHDLGDENPLSSVLRYGAYALKGMALTASGSDAILAPYQDAHDVYHRMKRERHSFDPHYNKARQLIGEGHGSHLRDQIERDLAEAFELGNALRSETPLLRYLIRVIDEAGRNDDLLIVLRHPEDAQQAYDRLLDMVTEPGRFTCGIANLRVTTPSRYASEIVTKKPSIVVWAASAMTGSRAYVGDAFAPKEFRLVVAGQDTVTLKRSLEIALQQPEYAQYHGRANKLLKALPWAPKDFGGISTSMSLDPDRKGRALPFQGQGYLLLDGYGKVAASPGTQFYVLDPVSQKLFPREARAIDVGDAVFVMPDEIREEIEALLREKDERGRTFEQAMVDQYKAIVKQGTETLSRQLGAKVTASKVHELLFAQNPSLPSIGRQSVDYWLRAADHLDVDTPFAASDPLHFEAFLRIMGAGVIAKQLADAVRIVRISLQRDGNTGRNLFDRLLLDPNSLIHNRYITAEKLQALREAASDSVYPVLECNLTVPGQHGGQRRQVGAI